MLDIKYKSITNKTIEFFNMTTILYDNKKKVRKSVQYCLQGLLPLN